MNLPFVSIQTPVSSDLHSPTGTRLQGHWRILAWVACAALSILTLGEFVASIPVYITQLQMLCRATSCHPGQFTTDAILNRPGNGTHDCFQESMREGV